VINPYYDCIVYFDLETTGLDPDTDDITEFACVIEFADGNTISFDELLFTDKKIPSVVVELNSITNHQLSVDGINPSIIANLVYTINNLSNKALLIAHNLQFDISFLNKLIEKQRLILDYNKFDVIDTLTVFKDRKGFYNHKLKDALKYYNLTDFVNSHRALDDVLALKGVFEAMLSESDDTYKYVNLLGFNPKYGVDYKELKSLTYRAQPYKSDKLLYECED
jgi:DNA polymerase III alpha subunit (gram-positive type)